MKDNTHMCCVMSVPFMFIFWTYDLLRDSSLSMFQINLNDQVGFYVVIGK